MYLFKYIKAYIVLRLLFLSQIIIIIMFHV